MGFLRNALRVAAFFLTSTCFLSPAARGQSPNSQYNSADTVIVRRTLSMADSMAHSPLVFHRAGRDYQAPLPYYDSAIVISKAIKNWPLYYEALSGKAFVYFANYDHFDATQIYQKILRESPRHLGDPNKYLVKAFRDLALIGWASWIDDRTHGFHDTYYEKATALNGYSWKREWRYLDRKGQLYEFQGHYGSSLEYHQRAFQIAVSNNSERYARFSAEFVALAYVHLNNASSGRDWFTIADSLSEETRFDFYASEADYYSLIGKYDLARESVKKTMREYIEKYGYSAFCFPCYQMALIYQKEQQFDKSNVYLHQTKKSYYRTNTTGPKYKFAADFNLELARNHLQIGDHDSALHYVQKTLISSTFRFNKKDETSLPEVKDINLYRQALGSLLIKAKITSSSKTKYYNPVIARDIFTKCDSILGRIQIRLLSERDKKYFVSLRKDISELELQFLLSDALDYQRVGNAAFIVSERSKMNLFSESFLIDALKSHPSYPDSLLTRENEIRGYLTQLTQRTHHTDFDKSDSLQRLLFEVGRQLQMVNQQVRKLYPNVFRVVFNNNVVDAKHIQSMIENDEVILEFFRGKHQSYVFAISKNHLRVQTIRSDSLDNKITSFRRHLRQSSNSNINQNLLLQSASDLYKTLLKPALARQELEGISKLLIIPDEDIGYIPFELLVSEPTDSGTFKDARFLIRDFQVNYLHSATLHFLDTKKATRLHNGILSMAPSYTDFVDDPPTNAALGRFRDAVGPLLWNKNEAIAITDYFPGTALVDTAATEANFKRLANKSSVLHLAMHALVDDQDPEQSKLVFSKNENDSTEDNLLHTFELYNMDLNAELAVLSACNTGYGKLEKGEGIISIARAFAYAGVPSLVMSHWPVDDKSTSELMKLFYKHLAAGQHKDEALRNAKLEFLENADAYYSHPFYWGGFVTVGNSDPITKAGNSYWLQIIIALLVCSAIVYFFWSRKLSSTVK